ncbi:glucose dehydrogenase [FAD, quinone] isoform X1 [Leptinotarsa decemlineata]|uniref:glucose dehydrogenase [FAD, quinone] isoform X1 n=1 Tax=Leptinotarsa decemlineata TaxID=7539 RepID=UPI003D3060FE
MTGIFSGSPASTWKTKMSGVGGPQFYGPPFAASCPGSSFVLFMSLVDSIFRNMPDVDDSYHRVKPKTRPDEIYDYIVVGGGAGGSTVAGRLAESEKYKILVIEAGTDEPTVMQVPALNLAFGNSNETSWGYKLDPEPVACRGSPQNRCAWSRAKMLGGCSSHHGLGYVRGVPRNYDDWEAAGNKGWSYKDVLPYFKKSEGNSEVGRLFSSRYHGTRGPMTIESYNYRPEILPDFFEAAKRAGFPISPDTNGEQFIGFSQIQGNMRKGVRVSCAKAFLRPHRNNPYLHVMLNSTATKIIINKDKVAVGVEFVYKKQYFTVMARKEVILAGGIVNTPQLLLLSGVGPKEDLDRVGIKQVHELPGVGKNLTDHVSVGVTLALKKLKNYNDLTWNAVQQYQKNRGGPLSAPGLTQLFGRFNSKYADKKGDNPDMLFMSYGFQAKCSRTGQEHELEDPEHPDAPKTIRISPTLLHPKSRGYISLRSKDPLEAPIIVANYLTESEDQERLLEAVRTLLRIFETTTLLKDKYGLELNKTTYGDCSTKHKFNSDGYWKCAMLYQTLPGEHQSSSCRMGPPSDRFAVVDNELRVYGIKNLRIADASVIPFPISGNTLATVVMVAEKAADFIKQK